MPYEPVINSTSAFALEKPLRVSERYSIYCSTVSNSEKAKHLTVRQDKGTAFKMNELGLYGST